MFHIICRPYAFLPGLVSVLSEALALAVVTPPHPPSPTNLKTIYSVPFRYSLVSWHFACMLIRICCVCSCILFYLDDEPLILRYLQLSMMDAGGGAAPSAAAADSMGNEDDDDDLRQAMLLSIQLANADAGAAAFQTPVAAPPSAAAAAPSGDDSMGADDDDEDIRLALLMSMQQDQAPPAEKKEEDGQGGGEGGGMDS